MKARSKLTIVIVLATVIALSLVVVQIVRSRGATGPLGGIAALLGETKSAIERWCGTQLLAIANAHLRPELAFDTLQFEFPATVTLTNVKLIDQNVVVLAAGSMRIEFTETPRSGKPIVIQRVLLTDPVLRLIQREDGTLLGLTNLVEKPARETTDDGVSIKPSDVFAIRQIGLVNGSISLELSNEPAMVLDRLNFDLATTPANEDPAQKGWYTIAGKASRHAILDWETQGRLNIDTSVLDIQKMTWQSSLSADEYSILPAELQTFAREHELTGDLVASLSGTIPLLSTADSVLDIQAGLTKGHMLLGDYVLPVKSLDVTARISGGALAVKPLNLASLGGTLQMDGTMSLSGPFAATMNVQASGMRIEQALRPVSDQPTKYAGRVDVAGAVTGQVGSLQSTVDGQGTLAITEGRLVRIPTLSKINEMITGTNAAESANDTGSSDWHLFGDHINFRKLEVVSSTIAARGEGEIMFDSTINFRVNAGPLEKAQTALGKVGELFGKVTDKIVQYEITGKLGDPVVTVRTLGIDLGLGK
jgi:hypothetical protein